MLLNGWEIKIVHGTTLKKGYIEFYYSRDCNGRLFAHYNHKEIKKTYVERREISEYSIETMLNEAEALHKTLLEYHGEHYYKSFLIKKVKEEFLIFNKSGDRIFKKFESVEACVEFIDFEKAFSKSI